MGSSIYLRSASPESEAAATKLRSVIGKEYGEVDYDRLARRFIEGRPFNDEELAALAIGSPLFGDHGGLDGGTSSSD